MNGTTGRPATDGAGSLAKWAVRGLALGVVLLLLVPVLVFAYPWLVAWGVIG